MPSHKLEFVPGTILEPKLRELLLTYFTITVLEKLERIGGRITFTLRPGPRKARREIQEIESDFISFIKNFQGDERELRVRLEPLRVKQLRGLAKEFKIPVKSKSTAAELIGGLVSYITASKKWTNISGIPPKSNS